MYTRIDHTNLKPNATHDDIFKLCEEARRFHFRGVCILPFYVPYVSKHDLKVSTVIDFPFGCASQKVIEAENCVNEGADELDVVWNQAAFANIKYLQVLKELISIVKLGIPVKVIVEECNLNNDGLRLAHNIVNDSGAFCIKTSTGYGRHGASLNTVRLWKSLDSDLKIKASGGIHTREQAVLLLDAGADIIGTSHGVEIMEEPQ